MRVFARLAASIFVATVVMTSGASFATDTKNCKPFGDVDETSITVEAIREFGLNCYNTNNIPSSKNAINWWNFAVAKYEDSISRFNLGLMHNLGKGVKKNETKAAEYYKAAAEQGLPQAQYNYGLQLYGGIGTSRNETKALDLIALAAEQGLTAAQYDLGIRYWKGDGVPQSYFQSFIWLNLVAQNQSSDVYISQQKVDEAFASSLTNAEKSVAKQLVETLSAKKKYK